MRPLIRLALVFVMAVAVTAGEADHDQAVAEVEKGLERFPEDASLAAVKGCVVKLREPSLDTRRQEMVEMYKASGQPLPDFELAVYGSDRKIGRKDLAGKVVVLNLWASWCGPCRMELPDFQKFYDKHSKDGTLSIWAVDAEESPARVQKFLNDKSYTFPILMDPKAFARFGIDGIPTTLIADASGAVRFQISGYSDTTDYVQLMEWLTDAASKTGARGQGLGTSV